MSLAAALIDRYFSRSAGELCIGQVPVSSIVDHYGTPLFIYDGGIVDRKLALLRDTLPMEFSIHYSVKANPNAAIIKYFVSSGCGLEVASAGEFARALKSGCPPEQVVFAGPGKTEAELEFAVKHNIGEIHIESRLEAERLSAICHRLATRARVAIRVNPSAEVQGGAMRMGGKPAPFGVDEEKLDKMLDYLFPLKELDFQGVHLFTGTQILDHKMLASQYRRGVEIAKRIAMRTKRPLHTVDFGGGLGIPYVDNDHELNIAGLGRELGAIWSTVRGESCFCGTRFVVEPGRYLVGEAGVYVARVNDIKISRGKKFLIVDGGMNHHLAASGNLGQVIKRNFPIAIGTKLDRGNKEKVDIVGPLCTPLDTLGRDVELPTASVGDLVVIFQSGAYALSASPVGFLSHPVPAEIMVYRKAGSTESEYTDCSEPSHKACFN